MRDLAAAAVAALSVWVAVTAVTFRRLTRGRSIVKTVGAWSAPGEGPPPRRALLESSAARFSRTRPGARLAAYAQKAHPAVPFSDVFAITLGSLIFGAFLGMALFPVGPLPALSALAGPVLADRILLHINGRRIARIEKDLPECLALQAAALRAGNSLIGSLRILAAEHKPPLSEEVALAVGEIDLGRSPETALQQLAARTGSPDVDLWVTAMLVHRTTGGSLTLVVEGLAERVRERLQLRGEIRALTAQGRMSGIVVAAAPLGFLVLMSITSRRQMQTLYETRTGWLLLTLGLAMEAAGFLWIRLILKVRP